jgi:hypothetical protein
VTVFDLSSHLLWKFDALKPSRLRNKAIATVSLHIRQKLLVLLKELWIQLKLSVVIFHQKSDDDENSHQCRPLNDEQCSIKDLMSVLKMRNYQQKV